MQALKNCLIMINPKHSNSATIEGNVIDMIYVGKLEIHTVLMYHCAVVFVCLFCVCFCLMFLFICKFDLFIVNSIWIR